jgi:hypothetical protein
MTAREPAHVVVDGSNIATEGRSMPSLAQLNDAVLAYRAEHPRARVTVVVDATFGHRIPKAEVAEFDAAVANNELVAPPAGAVGRGDAFVLGIAHKANATVLSNDSFQEFHGEYEWLFDEGRLVGGKPVPHVGWVFVERTPVRGPVSRKALRDSKRGSAAGDGRRSTRSRGGGAADGAAKKASREASLPMPVPTAPPPGRAVPADGVNELMPFLEFVERHPVGTSVNAIVDSYSSHGAYVRVGDVKGYVPLRLMGDPSPRSAREVMRIGDAVTLVVASFAPARRSIDLSLPQVHVAAAASGDEVAAEAMFDAVADAGAAKVTPAPAKEAARGRTAAKQTAKEAPAKRAAARAPAKKATAKEAPAKEAPAKKAPAKEAPAKAAAKKAAPAKKAAAKKAAPAKAAARKPATEAAAVTKRSPAKTSASTKRAAKTSSAKRGAGADSASDTPATASADTAARATPRRRRASKEQPE